jgi:hypothetical protein
LFVTVRDTYYPNNIGTCHVTIQVQHNTGIPQFQPTSYTVNVFEYEPSGFNFVNVTARDNVDNVRTL